MADVVRDAIENALDDYRRMDPDGTRVGKISVPEDAEIRALCERIGYGAVMDAAARLWFQIDPSGALVVGPCAAVARTGRDKLKAALATLSPREPEA